MKVSVNISPDHTEPCAVIYTDQMTDAIQHIIGYFNAGEIPVTARHNEKLIILQPEEIYMISLRWSICHIWTALNRVLAGLCC